jgi:signal transduction histidine kinase/sensor domain CHASE-containing protein
MTLRVKTLLALGITLIGLMLVLYLLLSHVLMDNYAALEAQQTRQHVQRVLNALERELDGLTRTADDWAAWNATRDFVGGTHQSYVADNLMLETFANLRLNLMLFYDSADQLVFARAVDLEREQEDAISPALREYLAAHPTLFRHSAPTDATAGIVTIDDRPLLLVVYPISSSDYGPIAGTLVFGRSLDAAEVERLGSLTSLDLEVYRWDAPQLPDEIRHVPALLSDQAPIAVQPHDEETIAGYAAYPDIAGQPALLLRVTTPRDVHAQGQASLAYLLLVILVAGLAFSAVTLLLIERLVFARIARLNDDVSRVYDTSGARLSVTGQDELSHLAQAMNQALDALEHAAQDQQQMTDQLLNSRNLLRAIFDAMNDCLLLLDHQGRVLAANQAMALLLGQTPQTMVGASLEQICLHHLPCGDNSKSFLSAQWVRDTLRDGIPRVQRARISCSGETTRVFDVQALPIDHISTADLYADLPYSNARAEPALGRVVLHVVDVTEKLNMEVLMVENERLVANRRLSQIVAHEVNSPLQTILFSLEALQAHTPPEQHAFLDVAQSEIERIGKILHQLKDLYHHTPEPHTSAASIHINTLIERVLLLIGGTLKRHEISVDRHLMPDLPPLCGRGDQLLQMLLNLSLNAVDSMREGGVLCITTSTVASAGLPCAEHLPAGCQHALLIDVADTGAGIPTAALQHIFEPFFTTKEHGSGLGLAVTKKIVAEHQGYIEVESQAGQGTTFHIYLPLLRLREP